MGYASEDLGEKCLSGVCHKRRQCQYSSSYSKYMGKDDILGVHKIWKYQLLSTNAKRLLRTLLTYRDYARYLSINYVHQKLKDYCIQLVCIEFI